MHNSITQHFMRGLLSTIILVLIPVCGTPSLKAQIKEMKVAHTYQEDFPIKEEYRWGFSSPGYIRMGLGACFDTEKLEPYVGATVTKVRFYFPEEKDDEALFVIYNSFDIPDEYPFPSYSERQVLMIKEGWNEVTLQSPIKIDGKRIIFPSVINISDKASRWVGTQDIDAPFDEMAAYVYDEGGPGRKSKWFKSGESPFFPRLFPFPIQLVLETSSDMQNADENKMAILNVNVNGYSKDENEIPATLDLTNYGSNDVSELEIGYVLGEDKEQTITKKINIPFSGKRRQSIDLNLNTPSLGRKVASFRLLSVNGKKQADETIINNTISRRIHVYDPQRTFKRTMVVERAATTGNSFNPIFADTLNSVLQPYLNEGKAIIMEHHFSSSGITDPYEIPEGKNDILDNYGLREYQTMYFWINREPMYSYSERGTYEAIFGYPLYMYDSKPTPFRNYMKEVLEDAYNKAPGLAKVDLHPINVEKDKLQMIVFGKISNAVSKNPKKIILAIVENGLPAGNQFFFDPNPEYVHNNTIITYLTQLGGENVQVEGDDFTYTSPKIDYKSTGTETKIVALLMDNEGGNFSDEYVLNANECDVTKALLSAPSINGQEREAYAQNGKIVWNDPTISETEVYTLSGEKVNNNNLNYGVYMVKGFTQDRSTIVIRKVIINQ